MRRHQTSETENVVEHSRDSLKTIAALSADYFLADQEVRSWSKMRHRGWQASAKADSAK
jgi:hypothetical protein